MTAEIPDTIIRQTKAEREHARALLRSLVNVKAAAADHRKRLGISAGPSGEGVESAIARTQRLIGSLDSLLADLELSEASEAPAVIGSLRRDGGDRPAESAERAARIERVDLRDGDLSTPLAVRRLDPRATLPARHSEHAAGLDLAACLPRADHPHLTLELKPGNIARVPTGLAIAIEPGYEGRSGLDRASPPNTASPSPMRPAPSTPTTAASCSSP